MGVKNCCTRVWVSMELLLSFFKHILLFFLLLLPTAPQQNINEICMSTNLCSFIFTLFLFFFGTHTNNNNNQNNKDNNQRTKKKESFFLPIKYLKECNTLTPNVKKNPLIWLLLLIYFLRRMSK